MKDILLTVFLMGMVHRFSKMENIIKDHSIMEAKMDMENTHGLMDLIIMENGKIIYLKAMDSINGLMGDNS